MRLCETKCQGGISYHFGGLLTSLKKHRAIKYRNIARHGATKSDSHPRGVVTTVALQVVATRCGSEVCYVVHVL